MGATRMQRFRPITSSLVIVVLLVLGLGTPVVAGKPTNPYISQMTGTAGWITDEDTGDPSWVMLATVHVRNAGKEHFLGYRVTWSDGTSFSEGGFVLPPPDATAESVLAWSLGPIPDGATSVTFAA